MLDAGCTAAAGCWLLAVLALKCQCDILVCRRNCLAWQQLASSAAAPSHILALPNSHTASLGLSRLMLSSKLLCITDLRFVCHLRSRIFLNVSSMSASGRSRSCGRGCLPSSSGSNFGFVLSQISSRREAYMTSHTLLGRGGEHGKSIFSE